MNAPTTPAAPDPSVLMRAKAITAMFSVHDPDLSVRQRMLVRSILEAFVTADDADLVELVACFDDTLENGGAA